MSSCPTPRIRFASTLRGAARRVRRGHVVAATATAAISFGLLGLRAVPLPEAPPISDGDRLRIELVPPVEPEIVPGPVMDVGRLVDGFKGLPPGRAALLDAQWSYDEDWDVPVEAEESPPRDPASSSEVRAYVASPEAERPSPARVVQRWFGFDAPRRDFQAERAARRARLEAAERRLHEDHESRRRGWAERRDEWARRRDRERDHDRWPEAEQRDSDRAVREEARDEAWRAREAFTGPR